MAFDNETRNRLKSFVSNARKLLAEEFTRQLQNTYGMNPATGEIDELPRLTHLDPSSREIAQLLRTTVEHYRATSPATTTADLLDRVVREQAFTVLNRLCALRLAEARGILIESIARSYQSKGFQLYARVANGALGDTAETFRAYLLSVFDELAIDLPVLFYRYSPQGRLFPREQALLQLLNLINHDDLAPLWTEDETIGWIYQYFNSVEERKKMRDESSAPRNSREMAVRNQFFTPRYVVEFLTDNTLGRTWYEMRKGRTALPDHCRYFVRRPNEVFLNPGQEPPPETEDTSNLSQEELWRRPVYALHRDKKDPRDLKVLDPAMGSGHFLLYAFDLLLRIYEEAWFDPDLGPALWEAAGFHPGIDETPSENCVDPASVRLKDSPALNHDDGPIQDLSGWYVVLADLYHTPYLSGRPLIFSEQECQKKQDRILLKIPLAEFDYQKAVNQGWIANQTGSIFISQLYPGVFSFRMRGPKDAMAEKLGQAAMPENLALLHRVLPLWIIELNLHGVDIDPRAVQIAGLALWLRAQKAWQAAGVKPADRPAIRKSHLVVAEPMPGEQDLLDDFLKDLKPALLGRLVRQVFDSMKLAGEAGTLLRVEDELQQEIEKARREWEALQKKTRAGGRSTVAVDMFSGAAPEQMEMELREQELMQISGERFWREAEDRVLQLLREYAEKAENGTGARRRLFADDAAKGFAFVDLCRTKFDVVVMNPPFGELSRETQSYAQVSYPHSKTNILTCFIERSSALVRHRGFAGAIISRTCFFLSSLSSFRTEVLGQHLPVQSFVDLGSGVLDAMVETAAATFMKAPSCGRSIFIRLLSEAEKKVNLDSCIHALSHGVKHNNVFTISPISFSMLNGSPYAYWVPPEVIEKIASTLPIEPMGGELKVGLQTSDDFRFLRLWNEVPSSNIFSMSKSSLRKDFISQSLTERSWVWYSKIDEASVFSASIHLVVNWRGLGAEIKAYHLHNGESVSRYVRSEDSYFLPGISYMLRSSRLVPYVVPKGGIPTAGRSQFFPKTGLEDWVLGLLASNLASAVARFRGENFGQPKFQNSMVAAVPYKEPEKNLLHLVCNAIMKKASNQRKGFQGDEVCIEFLPMPHLNSDHPSPFDRRSLLGEELDFQIGEYFGIDRHAMHLVQRDLYDSVVGTAGLDTGIREQPVTHEGDFVSVHAGIVFGRWDIRFATGEKETPPLPNPFDPLPVCPPGMLKKGLLVGGQWTEQDLPAEGPEDIPPGYPIDIPWDGILVDDPGHGRDIVARLKRVFEVIWGEAADDRLREAAELLGQKDGDLRPWLRKDFFPFHLQRYSKSRRKAPIYWPISTPSGAYTLWIYYHRLTDQTLLKAVNDFVEPKIDQVLADSAKLRQNTGRTKKQERELEALTDLEHELRDFREELLRIARFSKPNLNDGVQITAAPLWKLFQHKPWQKILKETWQKLEKGDYDWAHLAYSIWPARVREKCKTDKSLAIAHGLEDLYVEPPENKKMGKGRKRKVEVEVQFEEEDDE